MNQEWNITFLWYKKFVKLRLRWHILKSYHFVAEVTFNLNQSLLTFLLYVGQTWMTHLTHAISLLGVIFLYAKRILLLICMILQFMWRREFPLHWTYLLKTLQVPWLTHLLFLFRDLNVHHHNDWLTYSDETDTDLVNCYNLTWPYSDDWLPYSDPWLWFSQPCSFGFIIFFWR